MSRYRANWAYRAGTVALAEGDVVELDDATAAHITVCDSPGVLTRVDDETLPEPEPETEPAQEDEAEATEEPVVDDHAPADPEPAPSRRGGARRGS